MSTTAQSMSIGQVISYTTGRITISLQRTEHTYTVTTMQGGTLRIDDNSGSYSTEDEARKVARLYAETYRAEYIAELLHELHAAQRHPHGAERAARIEAELDRLETPAETEANRALLADIAETIRSAALADTVPTGTHRQVAPTMAGAQLADTSDPQQRAINTAAANGGTIVRGGGPGEAPINVLRPLVRKGLATYDYLPGARKFVLSVTLTKRGFAAVKAVA